MKTYKTKEANRLVYLLIYIIGFPLILILMVMIEKLHNFVIPIFWFMFFFILYKLARRRKHGTKN